MFVANETKKIVVTFPALFLRMLHVIVLRNFSTPFLYGLFRAMAAPLVGEPGNV
jgi:hypothetical protein